MRENINQLGGDIHSGNVRCRRCVTRQTGGFDPEYGIQICANELRNRGHLEDTMAHGVSLPSLLARRRMCANDTGRNGACLRSSTLQAELARRPSTCRMHRDSSLVPQRRMQMEPRVLHQGTVEAYAAASGMCEAASYSFSGRQAQL